MEEEPKKKEDEERKALEIAEEIKSIDYYLIQEKKLKPRSVKRVFKVLKAVLQRDVDREIVKKNVVTMVTLPRISKKEIKV